MRRIDFLNVHSYSCVRWFTKVGEPLILRRRLLANAHSLERLGFPFGTLGAPLRVPGVKSHLFEGGAELPETAEVVARDLVLLREEPPAPPEVAPDRRDLRREVEQRLGCRRPRERAFTVPEGLECAGLGDKSSVVAHGPRPARNRVA